VIARCDDNFIDLNTVAIRKCDSGLEAIVRERDGRGVVLPKTAARTGGADGGLEEVLEVSAEELAGSEVVGTGFGLAVGVEPVEEVHGLGTEGAHADGGHVEEVVVPDGGVGEAAACGAGIDEIDVDGKIAAEKMDGNERAAGAAADDGDAEGGEIGLRHLLS
jgi:hypothetical protein